VTQVAPGRCGVNSLLDGWWRCRLGPVSARPLSTWRRSRARQRRRPLEVPFGGFLSARTARGTRSCRLGAGRTLTCWAMGSYRQFVRVAHGPEALAARSTRSPMSAQHLTSTNVGWPRRRVPMFSGASTTCTLGTGIILWNGAPTRPGAGARVDPLRDVSPSGRATRFHRSLLRLFPCATGHTPGTSWRWSVLGPRASQLCWRPSAPPAAVRTRRWPHWCGFDLDPVPRRVPSGVDRRRGRGHSQLVGPHFPGF